MSDNVYLVKFALIVALILAVNVQSYGQLDRNATNATRELDDVVEIQDAILQIVESRIVAAQVSGVVMEIHPVEGDLVQKDEIIAKMDDRAAQLELEEARIESKIAVERKESDVEIEYAKKSRDVANAEYQRALESNLDFSGLVSDTEMDRLRLIVEKNDAELKRIEFEKKLLALGAQLSQAKVAKKQFELDRLTIRSQMEGKIVEINKRAGEWVETSESVFKIVRLDKLRIEDYVPADIATNDLLGAPARFSIELGSREQQFNGRVVFIDPEVNPLNAQSRIWVEIENPNLELRPGMKGNTTIQLQKSPK